MVPFSRYMPFIIALLLLSTAGKSQVIVSMPAFPNEGDSVTLMFDATQGNAGLMNYSGDVYAHTGVITSNSSSPSDWKYVKSNWGENTPATRMTRLSANTYELKIKPSIRTYYGVQSQEKILQMAFVFRSGSAIGGAYLEGKDVGGGDIFVNVYEPGLQLNLYRPTYGFVLLDAGDTLNVRAESFMADSMQVKVAGSVVRTSISSVIQFDTVFSISGQYWVEAVAFDSSGSKSDSFLCYVQGSQTVSSLPAGVAGGVNIVSPTEVILALYAPGKQHAFVLGDFNDWLPDSVHYMKKTPDNNYFWTTVNDLDPSKEYIYQYLVDGKIRIGDPYAEKVSDPWNDQFISYPGILPYPKTKTSGVATVLSTSQLQYSWQNTAFTPPPKEELIIYELLVRDFSSARSFKAVIDSLDYLQRLGINAIELMPVNEFEGNSSWGYNPNFYFAVDKYYGGKNDLKALIDSCHGRGIAVILDVVYNHSFGTSPYVKLYWDDVNNRPSAASPFYNITAKHDFNVGFDFNHESQATKRYISRALKFWLEEFRVDGFRFDLSKGFTQKNTLGNVGAWGAYDATRVQILQAYADTVWSVNPEAYVILEHFADNSEEIEFSNRGMMLWGNLNHQYAEAAMGYHGGGKSDFSSIYHKNRGWTQAALIGYAESHDEERIIYKCLQYGNKTNFYSTAVLDTALLRAQLDAAFLLTVPGPKMIWQFGELGYDYSIDYNGRTGEKPVRWDYLGNPDRRNLYYAYSSLMALRRQYSLFSDGALAMKVSGSNKVMTLQSNDLNLVVAGNFDVRYSEMQIQFPHDGYWFDFFSGDTLLVKGQELSFSFAPGEYHLFFDRNIRPEFPVSNIWKPTLQMPEGMGYVFPNPSSGDFSILLRNTLEYSAEIQVDIMDMNGRTLYSKIFMVDEERIVRMPDIGATLSRGVYFARIRNNALPDVVEVKKFVVYQ